MLVNPAKIQLLCISPAINRDVSSYISLDQGGKIESCDEIIVLGFKFWKRPTVAAHVDFIKTKMRTRSWIVRHLKQAGIPAKDILTVFSSSIRSVIEYASPAYHSLLFGCQSEDLEKMQRRALKVAYGYRTSYSRALELSGLSRLDAQRGDIFHRFSRKVQANSAFKSWLSTAANPDLPAMGREMLPRKLCAN